MEVYIREAQSAIGKFIDQEITLTECLAALDSALAAVSPTAADDKLRAEAEWNRRIVMETAQRRGQS